MERELTVERTRAGLEVARQLGYKGGRKRQMTESKIKSAKKLIASGVPPRGGAGNLGVSVPMLYRWIPASSQPECTQLELRDEGASESCPKWRLPGYKDHLS